MSFVSPRPWTVPQGEAEGNIEVEAKQNSLFPERPVIKCFVILPDLKIEKKRRKKTVCLTSLHTLATLAKLRPGPIEKSRQLSFSSQLTKSIDSTKVALV